MTENKSSQKTNRLRLIFILIFVVIAVLAAAATVLVLWKGSPFYYQEPTLLRVCWHSGRAVYPTGNEESTARHAVRCPRVEPLVWPLKQIPLKVGVNVAVRHLTDSARARLAVDQAAKSINRELGFLLLDPGNIGLFDMTVNWGVPYESGDRTPGFVLHHRITPQTLHCDLYQREVVSVALTYRILRHELLHCVGLAHDPHHKKSIMYPFTRDTLFPPRLIHQYITDRDRQELNRLYNRR